MPLPKPADTELDFTIRAIADDDEYVTLSDSINMKLPFNEGWAGWAIFQKGHSEPILKGRRYHRVEIVCRALNTLIVLEAT
jgi:hypothetical protein